MSGEEAVQQDAEQEAEESAELEESATSEGESEESEEKTAEKDTESDEEEDEEEEPEKPKRPRRNTAKRRISQLTYQVRELERKLGQQAPPAKPAPEAPPEFPTMESVNFDEAKYRTAVDQYVEASARHAVSSSLETEQQSQAEQTAQKAREERQSRFIQDGIAMDDDFLDMVADQSLPVTDAMSDAILEMDNGPAVYVHLYQNPDVAQKIAAMTPTRQGVEIGRLEARMAMPQANKTTSTPAPVKPVKGSGESVQKDPDKMTTDEWRRWREEQLKGN